MAPTATIRSDAKRSSVAKLKPVKPDPVDVEPVTVASTNTEAKRDITVLVRINSQELDVLFQAGLAGARIADNMRKITLAEAKRIIAGDLGNSSSTPVQ